MANSPPPTRSPLTLRAKATLTVLGVLGVALLSSAAGAIASMRSQSYADHGRATASAARGLAIASRVALFSGDAVELERLSKDLMADPEVSFVVITDGNGKPASKTLRDPATWEQVVAGVGVAGLSDRALVFGGVCVAAARVEPLSRAGDDIGLLDGGEAPAAGGDLGRAIVGLSTDRLLESMRYRTTALAMLFGAVALAATPLVWLVAGRWARRISTLAAASERIAAGDLENGVSDPRNDEIGLLTQAFDAMRLSVRDRDERMRTMNDTLHDQVLERTRELENRSKELERAVVRAEAASRAKSDFLANMSHEIRTPMTAILGYADLLLDAGLSEEDRRGAVLTVRRSGDHLLSILNDILDISKIEAGRFSVSIEPTDLPGTVSDVADLMRARAESKGIALTVRYEGAVPRYVKTDSKRLRQILMNLIGNAVKFTETGGVTVGVKLIAEGSPRLQIAVSDTGIGLTPDQLGRLFQPFSQADETMSRRYGGTGLGLAIARRLAGLLGGEIGVTSTEGAGSTFTLTIDPGSLVGATMLHPDEASAEPVAGAARAEDAPQRLEARVLLAEDGPDNQRLIAHHLRKAGADVMVAANGRIALESAMLAERSPAPFDIVLMDMQMPEMDGYTATGELRALGFSKPIVALTAHAMAGDRERCLAAGCDDYMTKPIDRATLIRTCARWLNRGGGSLAA
ncbi:MAG: ATP-binding protein [Phycisphaerales bacterium]